VTTWAYGERMIAPRVFSLDYLEHAVLRDGTKVVLRLVRPDDKAILRDGFNRWSPESRYARFFGPKASLSDDELRYLCEVDHENHVAIGALRDDDAAPPVGLGIARFVRLADRPDTAEAAMAVADDSQRKGLGKLLLMRLIAAAAERGITRFRSEVLGSNAAMVALLTTIAPDHALERSAGVVAVELELPALSPTEPLDGAPLEGPIYRVLRAAAQNAVEWTDAVRRLWRH
jgi:GNAT superfamily N-acetyltransferase